MLLFNPTNFFLSVNLLIQKISILKRPVIKNAHWENLPASIHVLFDRADREKYNGMFKCWGLVAGRESGSLVSVHSSSCQINISGSHEISESYPKDKPNMHTSHSTLRYERQDPLQGTEQWLVYNPLDTPGPNLYISRY